MKKIAITFPEVIDGDARLIVRALKKGYDRVHLRKPSASIMEIANIIEKIPLEYRSRVTLHEHHSLAGIFGLGGIHLNRRFSDIPIDFKGLVSRSCHSFDEIIRHKDRCDYLFLSPIYNSISKAGYCSNFTAAELAEARRDGIIDSKVYALGGVTEEKFAELADWGFGGGAMLGSVWSGLMNPPVVLSIAGSDSCGGAGIQADIKTISALDCYAASVITAITAQNTLGVSGIEPVTPSMIAMQMQAVFDDLNVAGVKIGMIHNSESALAIVKELKNHPSVPIVCDPVMLSTSGTELMKKGCRELIENELFPLCTLITPNLLEAELLSGMTISTPVQMKSAAISLSRKYGCAVLVKGGHLDSDTMSDVLYDGDEIHEYSTAKINSANLHGTGCTLSSAIASHLSLGAKLPDAVAKAKTFVHKAISNAALMNIGKGNGPLWHF